LRVLFLFITFPEPEVDDNLYTDLAEEFHKQGQEVYVTTFKESGDLSKSSISEERGFPVLRVGCGKMFNVNYIRKALTMMSIPRKYISAIKKHFGDKKFDLVVYPTPPITLAPVVKYIKKRDNARTYLILRDIFPQNAKDLGMIKSELVFKYFRKKEQQLYDISDRIGCMSQGNVDYVLKHNKIPKEKLEILYNWKKPSNLPPIDKEEVKKSYGLEGKFVAFFGGNIGYAQELEFLIELAECYKTRDDIVFLIVGKGVMKPKIENLVKEKQLQNVRFIDYLPRDEYEKLLRAADVGLINLSRKFTIPNIPSKAVSYMEAGIPILAATDKYTDFGKMIEDIGAGLWCETGDLVSYRNNLEKLLTDTGLREKIRERAMAFMKDNMTTSHVFQRILAIDIA